MATGPIPLELEVQAFSVLQVTEIAVVAQRYRVVVLVQLRVRNVDADDPLRAPEDVDARGRVVFPFANGKPTFKYALAAFDHHVAGASRCECRMHGFESLSQAIGILVHGSD